MTPHLLPTRDPRQAVCGIPAELVRRWDTENPPRSDRTCEDCLTLLPDAARPANANHPAGDETLIDTLRYIVADRQHAKIDGVLIDLWSAAVTVQIWDHLHDDKRQRLLRLPSSALILQCLRIYAHLTAPRGDR